MRETTFAVIGDSAASGVGDSDSHGNYFGWGYHLAQAFIEPISYINVARPGAQASEVLNEQLPKVLIHEPEIVAVIVGGNDILRNGFSPTRFEFDLYETLAQIERMGAISLLLQLHDPTQIVPMPKLLQKICRRRVDAVNSITQRLGARFNSIVVSAGELEDVYARDKWHVDRMHPSRYGHQFLADAFAHKLRERGYVVGDVARTGNNNRSRKDSVLWMIRNGVPWFAKRSFDLLPSLIILMSIEVISSFNLARRSPESYVLSTRFISGARHEPIHYEKVRVY